MFVIEDRRIGKFMYYVECKQYAPTRPVGVHVVRELYGSVMADKATAGLVVTSSYFSEDANVFSEKIKYQMSLMDYASLTNAVREVQSKI